MADFKKRPVPFDEALTFTRGSEATYFDAGGVLRTAAVDEPRFTHDPVTGKTLGLLIEGQRTNYLVRSEEFETFWNTTNSSVSSNAQSSPEGTLSADKLVESTNNSPHGIFQSYGGFTSGVAYTFSVFVKAAERTKIRLSLNPQAFPDANREADFDLTNGAIIRNFGSDASIESFGDGWYRVSVTQTADLTASDSCTIYMKDGADNVVYLGDGTSGLYIWGAQLEQGLNPSSYIPTEDAQVTRAADNCSRTLGDEFNASEGTLYGAITPVGGVRNGVGFSDGTLSNRLFVRYINGSVQVLVSDSGATQATVIASGVSGVFYFALSYSESSVLCSVNGQPAVNVSFTGIPNLTTLYIKDSGLGVNDLALTINKFTGYFPRALSEQELIALTTPEA